jgi:hypothetical protein
LAAQRDQRFDVIRALNARMHAEEKRGADGLGFYRELLDQTLRFRRASGAVVTRDEYLIDLGNRRTDAEQIEPVWPYRLHGLREHGDRIGAGSGEGEATPARRLAGSFRNVLHLPPRCARQTVAAQGLVQTDKSARTMAATPRHRAFDPVGSFVLEWWHRHRPPVARIRVRTPNRGRSISLTVGTMAFGMPPGRAIFSVSARVPEESWRAPATDAFITRGNTAGSIS